MVEKNGVLKSIAKVALFLVILALVVFGIDRTLMLRNSHGVDPVQTYYAQPEDSVDVLFLGSSHVFENVNTGVLWEEEGIASFDLSGSIQPLWNTYYYLKEALKTQRPKLVVLDAFRAIEEDDYLEHAQIYANTLGLNPSLDKLDATMASTPQWEEYLLGLSVYHSRYGQLDRTSFLGDEATKDRDSWKGYVPNWGTVSLDSNLDVDEEAFGELPLSEKSEEYLVKILELLKEEDIPLLIVNAPFPVASPHIEMYNHVKRLAEEYGADYLSIMDLFDGAGLNFVGDDTDFGDGYHLNYKGSAKYSKYLAQYIKENYDIPDHRGDDKFVSWDIDAKNIRALIDDHEIAEIKDLPKWLKRVLKADRFTLAICFKSPGAGEGAPESALSEMRDFGFDITEDDLANGFAAVVQDGQVAFLAPLPDLCWSESLFSGKFAVQTKEGETSFRLGLMQYPVVEKGITAFLYDDLRGELVEVSSWEYGSSDNKKAVKAQ